MIYNRKSPRFTQASTLADIEAAVTAVESAVAPTDYGNLVPLAFAGPLMPSNAVAEDEEDDDDSDAPSLRDAAESDDEDGMTLAELKAAADKHARRMGKKPVAASELEPVPVEKKKRGRPRKDPSPEVPVFDPENLPAMDFSLTITSRGQHVPPLWLKIAAEFCEANGPRGYLSLERGGKHEMLHIQASVSLYALTDKATCEKIKKLIKDALGVKRGDGTLW